MQPATNRLERSTPEAEGIPSSAILRFVDAVEKSNQALHSMMLLRHGRVVAEGWWTPYAADRLHMLFSLSKSFTSTAVGLAVAEGQLTVEDRVVDFFPEETPATVSDNLAAMRVKDLLTMTTGHDEDVTGALHRAGEGNRSADGNWVKAFLAQPVAHQPGTHFVYNSAATYMLSAIVQKLTGQRLLHYLGPRLFEPLGIEGPTWDTCPRGIDVGGWGLKIKTEDIACFGQLYLQQGVWRGQGLLPADWVAAATSYQVSNASNTNPDWKQGYGYQFWRCQHDAYRGDGAFGQFCIVIPAYKVVLAITSGAADLQKTLDLVWEHLLPAIGSAPLAENHATHEALGARLAKLTLPPAQGQPTSLLASQVSGKRYHFAPNEQGLAALTLAFQGSDAKLTLHNSKGEHQIHIGSGTWCQGTTSFEQGATQSIAASGAWSSSDTYALKVWYDETPFCVNIRCRFVADQLYFDYSLNVSFGPTERPQLVGRLA
jgi:CubicO group peptidase (beta-lactamase class C family)